MTISLGIRHSFGLFLQPMSLSNEWGREVFAFSIAMQNLVWGVAQPLWAEWPIDWGQPSP
ncbi:hypothetical protein [Limnobacter sp. SAORIC-690]|uniref:hypothetical protein n=1 Tax=Limnobacter sp. SAORIC-690 TaxID=1923970 RepID=UPI003516CDEF